MLHPELSIRRDISFRFLREGYVANSVKHPGAVAVLDDDVAEDGAAFLVMELLEGDGVDRLWESAGRRLPVRVVLAIGHQLLDVLDAAHAKTIVHRDIKPANIFVTREGALKVLDFGIARLRDVAADGGQATHTGLVLGTPAFMAPEQALAKSSEIDGQTDLWAVGATLFMLLTGHLVHEGDNASQILVKAATEEARPIAAVASGVAPRVAELIDRALAFRKGGRWPSATAMRDAIRDAYLDTFGEVISRAPLAALFPEKDAALAAEQATSLPGTLVEAGPTPLGSGRGQLAGRTTAEPVSRARGESRRATAPRSSAAQRLGRIGVIVVVLGIGGGLIAMKFSGAMRGSATSDAPPSASSVATPPQMRAESAAGVAAPTSTPVPTSVPASAPIPTVAPPLAVPIGKHARVNVRPVSSASPSAAPAKSASPAPTPLPAPAAAPTCHVVTYFDAEGNKRFKQECP
jgi:serine/threonine-protein kinase